MAFTNTLSSLTKYLKKNNDVVYEAGDNVSLTTNPNTGALVINATQPDLNEYTSNVEDKLLNSIKKVKLFGNVNSNLTINPKEASLFKANITSNICITILSTGNEYNETNKFATGSEIAFYFTLPKATYSEISIAWPASIIWEKGITPELSTTNIFTFITFDGDTWYGTKLAL